MKVEQRDMLVITSDGRNYRVLVTRLFESVGLIELQVLDFEDEIRLVLVTPDELAACDPQKIVNQGA